MANPRLRVDRRSSPGIDIEWLLTSEAVGVTRWRCLCSRVELSGEKHQLWHEIVFLHAGSFLIRAEHGSTVIDSNWLLYFNPLRPYQTAHPFGCGDRGSALAIREEVVREVLAERAPALLDRDDGLFPAPRALSSPDLYARQRLLIRSLASAVGDPLRAEEEALHLVDSAIAALVGSERHAPLAAATVRLHREQTEAALAIVQRRFHEPLTVGQVAAAVGLSSSHFCRVFRHTAGLPLHRYVNRLRLRAALDAVEGGASDLMTVALDLGYSSHAHFTAAFHREFRVPPSRLRQPRGLLPSPTSAPGAAASAEARFSGAGRGPARRRDGEAVPARCRDAPRRG